MSKHKIDLSDGEEVVFESSPAILTTRRLLANWKGDDGSASDEALLKNLESFQKFNGGRESQMATARQCIGVGLALISIEFVFPNIPKILASVLFLLGACGLLFGIYLVIVNFLRIRPHTIIFFKLRLTAGTSNERITVAFPGDDNPEAEELTRTFTRLKRKI